MGTERRDAAGILRPRLTLSVLRDDLYTELESWPRIGRLPKHDLETWSITHDWPERVPVSQAELDAFDVWVGDLFDEYSARRDELTRRLPL